MPDTQAYTFFQPLHLQPKFVRQCWWLRLLLGLLLLPLVTIFAALPCIIILSLLVRGSSVVFYAFPPCIIFGLLITYKIVSNSCGKTLQRFITIPKERSFATAQLAIWQSPIPLLQWRFFSPEEVKELQLVNEKDKQELYLNISRDRSLELHSDEKEKLAAQLAEVLEKKLVVLETPSSSPRKSILWTETIVPLLIPFFLALFTFYILIQTGGTPRSAWLASPAYDCFYLYEGATKLNNVEVSVFEADGTSKVVTKGVYWRQQETARAKPLTIAKDGHTHTLTIPAPTDFGLYQVSPYGEPNFNSIGKRRYFKVDLEEVSVTLCSEEKSAHFYLTYLLGATLLLFVVIYGIRKAAAPAKESQNA